MPGHWMGVALFLFVTGGFVRLITKHSIAPAIREQYVAKLLTAAQELDCLLQHDEVLTKDTVLAKVSAHMHEVLSSTNSLSLDQMLSITRAFRDTQKHSYALSDAKQLTEYMANHVDSRIRQIHALWVEGYFGIVTANSWGVMIYLLMAIGILLIPGVVILVLNRQSPINWLVHRFVHSGHVYIHA